MMEEAKLNKYELLLAEVPNPEVFIDVMKSTYDEFWNAHKKCKKIMEDIIKLQHDISLFLVQSHELYER